MSGSAATSIYIDPLGLPADRAILPDLKVRSVPRFGGASASSAAALAEEEAAPIIMHGLIEAEVREKFLEIRDVDAQSRLVTCLEVLSPTNKRSGTAGWYLYQHKRQVFLQGHANLVEIDLLRGGTRMPMVEAWTQEPYHIAVLRREEAPRFRVLPGHFNAALPRIPIPLAHSDPDISLPLQALVDAVYDRARYHLSFDYRQPLSPPLSSVEAQWLEEQLAHRPAPRA